MDFYILKEEIVKSLNLTLGVVIAVILAACKVPRRQHVTAHPQARVGPAPH